MDTDRPSTLMMSVADTLTPSSASLPFTVILPSRIQVSTWRREPWPARARTFCKRSAKRGVLNEGWRGYRFQLLQVPMQHHLPAAHR